MVKIFLFSICSFIIILDTGIAQSKPYLSCRNITENDGLTSNNITSIAEDKDGFIWVGTNNGLNKYDGKKISKYKAGNNIINMKNNQVQKIIIDDSNNLILNQKTCISVTSLSNNKIKYDIDNISINGLSHTNSTVLISHSKGIIKYNASKNICENKTIDIKIKYNNKFIENYTELYSYKDKYIAISHYMIFIFDSNFNLYKKIDLKENTFILSLYFHNEVAYIFCWNDKIFELNMKNFKVKDLLGQDKGNYIAFNGTNWHYKGNEYIAVAEASGLLLYDIKRNIMHKYYSEFGDVVNAVFCDSRNNLWIATAKSGIFLVSDLNNTFKTIDIGKEEESKYIWGIKYIDNKYFVSTRYDKGLYIYDENWHFINHIGRTKKYKTSPSNIVDCFDVQKNGNEYLCSNDFGSYSFNLFQDEVKIRVKSDHEIKLRDFVTINKENYLVRSVSDGIYKYNITKHKLVKAYKIPNNTNSTFYANCLKKIENETIYLFTNIGHFIYNETQDSFVEIKFPLINREIINDIISDQDNYLWLSTSNGLYKYDSKKRNCTKYFENDDDLNSNLDKLVYHNQNLWGSSLSGFFCYNIKSKKLKKFDKSTGIMGMHDKNTFKVNSKETLTCSGSKIYIINDSLFQNYKENNKLYFTSVTDGSTEYLNKSNMRTITLSPENKNLFIKFVSPSYLANDNMDFYYFSKENKIWSKLEANELFLSNLSHGKHEISLKAVNKITAEETETKELNLILKPYWYQTNISKALFFLLGISLLLFALWYYMYLQRRRLEIRKKLEQKIISMEMDNLRSQMNPHFLFNALNSINKYVIENETKLASDYLSKFSRLMRLILENSKHELILLSSEVESLELYLLIEANRFDMSFSYEVNKLNISQMNQIMIPPLIIQPFAENAIWHGLHHKPSNKKLQINFELDHKEEFLLITIEDNGIGREKSKSLSSKTSTKTKSYGIETTTKRLQFLGKKNSVIVSDRIENDVVAGTNVIIKYYIQD